MAALGEGEERGGLLECTEQTQARDLRNLVCGHHGCA